MAHGSAGASGSHNQGNGGARDHDEGDRDSGKNRDFGDRVEGQWHSWFAAYAPFETDKPEDRVVVVVMAEASPNWEWWAPKAANLIFQGIFANQTYQEVLAKLKPWYAPVAGRVE